MHHKIVGMNSTYWKIGESDAHSRESMRRLLVLLEQLKPRTKANTQILEPKLELELKI